MNNFIVNNADVWFVITLFLGVLSIVLIKKLYTILKPYDWKKQNTSKFIRRLVQNLKTNPKKWIMDQYNIRGPSGIHIWIANGMGHLEIYIWDKGKREKSNTISLDPPDREFLWYFINKVWPEIKEREKQCLSIDENKVIELLDEE